MAHSFGRNTVNGEENRVFEEEFKQYNIVVRTVETEINTKNRMKRVGKLG